MSSTAATKSGSTSLCRVVNASEIASGFSQEIKKAIFAKSETSSSGSAATSSQATRPPPKLVGFLVGSKDSPSATYASWTEKACQSVGIEFELRFIEPPQEEQDIQQDSESDKDANDVEQSGLEISAADLETAILEANSDP